MLSKRKDPLAESIITNVALMAKKEGGIGINDSNRFESARIIGSLSIENKVKVLCKPWMVADLVYAANYHWNGEAVISWIEEASVEDRAKILSTDAVLYSLLLHDERDNSAIVKKWFDEQPDDKKVEILNTEYVAQSFINIWGEKGLKTVEHYLSATERAEILSDERMLFVNFKGALAFAFLKTLPDSAIEKFTDPKAFYFTPNHSKGEYPEHCFHGDFVAQKLAVS